MKTKASEIQRELETYIDPVKRDYLPGFFKTDKGQYGEGDLLVGCCASSHDVALFDREVYR